MWLVLAVLVATMAGFVGSTIVSQHVVAKLDEGALSIAMDAAPSIEHLSAARRALFRILLAADSATQRAVLGAPFDRAPFDEALTRLHNEVSAYQALPFFPAEREHFVDVVEGGQTLQLRLGEFTARLAAGDSRGAAALKPDVAEAAWRTDGALGYLVAFNAEQQHRLAMAIPQQRNHGTRLGYLLQGVTALLGLISMGLVMRTMRQYARLLRGRNELIADRAREVASFGSTLESIIDASIRISEAITATADPKDVFQIIADQAREVVGAQYCAVGCGTDRSRRFDPWVSSGMSPATVAALGGPPHPDGLFGAVIRERHPIRLADVKDHPAFRGLPAAHPPLGSFMGVPILRRDTNVANVFLARPPSQPPFTEQDECAATLLAGYVAVAIENSELYRAAVAATAAREDLLATVSHDLKNPLNAIRLTTHTLRGVAGDGKAGELITRIDRAAERMMSLIHDLLDASKIEAGLFYTERRPEDIRSLLNTALGTFQVLAADKSLQITSRIPPVPAKLFCDRALVLRVFANLLSNAIKFSPAGSSIAIVVEPELEQVHFSVSDAGPGIPADYAPHVFDRYWQAKGSDRRGSGLGLYIAKGIVEAHDGRIWIDSAAGRGTTVHFTLPVADEQPVSGADPKGRRPPARPARS